MKRLALTTILTVLMAGTALAGPLPRNEVIVSDNQIRLGDVFDGITAHADYALAPAPESGKEIIWNAHTLQRISTAFKLDWKPSSAYEQVRIRRMVNSVPEQDVEAALKASLASKGVTGAYRLSVENNALATVTAPHDTETTVAVTAMDYNAATGLFKASLRSPATGANSLSRVISGVVEQTVQVPVLRSRLNVQAVIASADLDWIEMRSKDVRADVLLDADKIVGLSPRRNINTGQPIRMADLESPRLVKRGDTVTMLLSNDKMQLTALGRALQDGVRGDVVKISNLGSSRTVEAIVSGDRQVTIQR